MFNLNLLIMGLLDSPNCVPCAPEPELFPFEFRESFPVQKEEKLHDENGKFIRMIKTSVVETRSVPDDVLEHRGISADLFRIENQFNAGVALSPVNVGSFLQPSLDERSQIEDSLNAGIDAIEKEASSSQPANSNDVINFNENE